MIYASHHIELISFFIVTLENPGDKPSIIETIPHLTKDGMKARDRGLQMFWCSPGAGIIFSEPG